MVWIVFKTILYTMTPSLVVSAFYLGIMYFTRRNSELPEPAKTFNGRKKLIETMIGNVEDTDDFLIVNKKINKYAIDFSYEPDVDDNTRILRQKLDKKIKKKLL